MKSFKRIIIYLFVCAVVISLFSSFETDGLYIGAAKISKRPNELLLVFADRIGELSQGGDDTPDITSPIPTDETRAKGYKLGDSSPFVTHYKTILWRLGFIEAADQSDITAEYDDAMQQAVSAYQRSIGISETGELDEAVMTQLDAELARIEE